MTLGLSSDGSKLPSRASAELNPVLNNHVTRGATTPPAHSSPLLNNSNSSPVNDHTKKVSLIPSCF